MSRSSEKSFTELPDVKQFLRNRSERAFQQPQDFATATGGEEPGSTLDQRNTHAERRELFLVM
jgi:hypothetical protein